MNRPSRAFPEGIVCRFQAMAVVAAVCWGSRVQAQEPQAPPVPASRIQTAAKVVAGAALGFALHEGGHLAFDLLLGATPGVKGLSGVPFFAITHEPVSFRREFVISSAGFWAQRVSSEVVLSRHPRLRGDSAPVAKGLLAFNLVATVAYAGLAVGRIGPRERDTLGMARSTGIAEPWMAPVILLPTVLDTVRYLKPESRAARWASRLAKTGSILLVLKSRS